MYSHRINPANNPSHSTLLLLIASQVINMKMLPTLSLSARGGCKSVFFSFLFFFVCVKQSQGTLCWT